MRPQTLARTTVTAALALLLGVAVIELGDAEPGLAETVYRAMPESGVKHPVTAVLLNFRAYDTWLELVVLLLAALGASQNSLQQPAGATSVTCDPVLLSVARFLGPVMLLVAGYLLLTGTSGPGGAFPAGAVLAAAATLMHHCGHTTVGALPPALSRVLLVSGVAAFGVVAALGLWGQGAMLQYPAGNAARTIVLLELAAALSIGIALASLVTAHVRAESRRHGGSNRPAGAARAMEPTMKDGP